MKISIFDLLQDLMRLLQAKGMSFFNPLKVLFDSVSLCNCVI